MPIENYDCCIGASEADPLKGVEKEETRVVQMVSSHNDKWTFILSLKL